MSEKSYIFKNLKSFIKLSTKLVQENQYVLHSYPSFFPCSAKQSIQTKKGVNYLHFDFQPLRSKDSVLPDSGN